MSGLYGAGPIFSPQLGLQEFTASGLSGLFQPPTNLIVPTLLLRAEGIGAGAGGGSGRRGIATTLLGGGGGGSSGMRTIAEWTWQELANMIGVSILDLYFRWDIGPKGIGGAVPAGTNVNGLAGTSGGTTRLRIQNLSGSVVRTILQAGGGAGGAGGAAGNVSGGGGIVSPGTFAGAVGGAGTAGIGNNGTQSNNTAGAGAGGAGQGAILATNAGGFGGAGGVGDFGFLSPGAGPGLDASTSLPSRIPGAGGGGGPTNVGGQGGRPGNGYRGGGGGGGPGTVNGTATFPGGDGGDGYGVMIWRA